MARTSQRTLGAMRVIDLGTMSYAQAWAEQERLHAAVLAGEPPVILMVEHLPVVTLGRRPDVVRHLRVSAEELADRGVELVQTDRGGDITYHGPGQLVCYPIVRLAAFSLGVSDYVHGLERAVISLLNEFQISAHNDPKAVGVWCDATATEPPAKIAAIGVRIRKGVSLHGLALNVTTALDAFDLIVPCGLAGRPVTSMQKQLGDRCPTISDVKRSMAQSLFRWLSR